MTVSEMTSEEVNTNNRASSLYISTHPIPVLPAGSFQQHKLAKDALSTKHSTVTLAQGKGHPPLLMRTFQETAVANDLMGKMRE
jgi:hypothetical protein